MYLVKQSDIGLGEVVIDLTHLVQQDHQTLFDLMANHREVKELHLGVNLCQDRLNRGRKTLIASFKNPQDRHKVLPETMAFGLLKRCILEWNNKSDALRDIEQLFQDHELYELDFGTVGVNKSCNVDEVEVAFFVLVEVWIEGLRLMSVTNFEGGIDTILVVDDKLFCLAW